MLIPWWFALIVWPLFSVVFGFTVGYMMATGRPPWSRPRRNKRMSKL